MGDLQKKQGNIEAEIAELLAQTRKDFQKHTELASKVEARLASGEFWDDWGEGDTWDEGDDDWAEGDDEDDIGLEKENDKNDVIEETMSKTEKIIKKEHKRNKQNNFSSISPERRAELDALNIAAIAETIENPESAESNLATVKSKTKKNKIPKNLRHGTLVKVFGLVKGHKYNGCIGTIDGPESKKGRFPIKLCRTDNTILALRKNFKKYNPENDEESSIPVPDNIKTELDPLNIATMEIEEKNIENQKKLKRGTSVK